MTDISNTINALGSLSADAGHVNVIESPEVALSPEATVSPEIGKVLDLILPKSAVELLQGGCSLPDGISLNIEDCHEEIRAEITTPPASVTSDVFMTTCASTGHLTTHTSATTVVGSLNKVSASSHHASSGHLTALTTATSVVGSPSEVLTSADHVSSGHITTPTSTNTVMSPADVLKQTNGSDSPALSLAHFPADCPAAAVSNTNSQGVKTESLTEYKSKKPASKSRISRADLEIISSCGAFNEESLEKSSRRFHSADLSSSECHSRGGSDSEDMRRPFASIAREKKKQKRRKKKEDSDSVKSSSSSSGVNDKISTGIKSVIASSLLDNSSTVYPSESNSPLSLTDYICDRKMPEEIPGQESLSYENVINTCAARLSDKDRDSHSWIVENGYIGSNNFDKHSDIITEETSNISFSSAKENENRRLWSTQKLPKIRSHRFNILKHKNKIRNTFPPCFIVVEKLSVSTLMNSRSQTDSILPLSTRLKHLSELCDQGLVKCKKKKQEAPDEVIYRNIFEETILPETTEDDWDSSRRRNLRKRDKHISYVEPSEDDILDEFSRKRHRSKFKDTEDESTAENKKRKKQMHESKIDISNTDPSVTVASPQESSNRKNVPEDTGNCSESSKIKINQHKTKSNEKEIIVYPPASLGSTNYYRVRNNSAAGKTSSATNASRLKQKSATTVPVSPPSTSITVLPTTTVSGTFMQHPNPLSLFSSLPLGMPGSFPPPTLIAGAPLSSQISTAGGIKKYPQYCVVKMDGKDVLLQIVPSPGIGTPVPVVVPKGKSFVPQVPFVSGSQLFGQPFQQLVSLPSSTQSVAGPLTSVVTVSQSSAVSSGQPLMGIQVLGRPITTSSHNVSLSALPLVPPAQLTSLTNTTSVRPMNLSSSIQQISPSSAASLLAPINLISASNSDVSATSVASAASRTISALPASFAPMPAPNTTTVVRTVRLPGPNLRAVVPNQSTSLRSFRIFVPGCSATGMPSRFATLGAVANSSPLTHMTASSSLLPQRKHGSDLEMTPEQRAAKRRKLEKKYPLPPGVVIKTEPLDTVPNPSPVITTGGGSRSLLSQNLHLLSASRPGTNFQSIRIISPSLANSLAARNLRGNSNIIYRAASIGGGQTILLPTSLGQMSTRTTTTLTSVSITSSPALATSSSALATSSSTPLMASASEASDNTIINAANSLDSSVVSSVPFSSFRAISDNLSSSALQSTEGTSTAACVSISSSDAILPETNTTSLSSVNAEPLVTTNGFNTTSASPLTSGTDSLHNSGTSSVSRSLGSSSSLASAKGPCEVGTVENVRNALEELRKFIQIQEANGLKGDRLEKLKQLFQKKEEQYKQMLQLTDGGIPLLSAPRTNGDVGAEEDSNVAVDLLGGSETDPFVID